MEHADTELDDVLRSGQDAFQQGKWTDAISAFRRALELKGRSRKGAPTSAERARGEMLSNEIRVKLGHCLRMMGRIDEAQVEFEAVKTFAEDAKDDHLLAEALLGIGFCAWRKGEHEEGIGNFRKVIELADGLHDLVLKGKAYTGLGSIALVRRRVDEGAEAYETALKLLKGSGQARQDVARATHNLAFLYMKKGDAEKAEKTFKRAMRLSEDIKDVHTSGFAYSNLAHLLVDEGRLKEARDHLERAGRLLARTNDRIGLNLVIWVRGLLRSKEGDVEGAIMDYRKAKKGFEEMGLKTQVFHMTMDYVPVFRSAGMKDELVETLEKVKASFDEKGFTDLLDRIIDIERRQVGPK